MAASPVWARTCGSYIGRGKACETCGWSKKSHLNWGRCPTCSHDMTSTIEGRRSLKKMVKKGGSKK